MKNIVWITDPHFNFVEEHKINSLIEEIWELSPHFILLGGDIAEGEALLEILELFEKRFTCPVYFVLGNHDYYGKESMEEVEKRVFRWLQKSRFVKWLRDSGVVEITDRVCLVGHGCWADGRNGDFFNSNLTDVVFDYKYIPDLAELAHDKNALFEKINELGDMAAGYLEEVLYQAVETYDHILLLTHVPPFDRSAWYRRKNSNPHGTPHFSSQTAGESIISVMRKFPKKHLTVLTGHSHNSGISVIRSNITVITGGAEYHQPQITDMLCVDE